MFVSEKSMDLLVMCIGNRDGGDDSVGPYIADCLKREEIDFKVIDCGVIPENYTADVKRLKPRTLVIVDAVEMNLEPGEIRVVPRERIGVMHISTHGIPASLLINYLKQYVEDIVFVGIQPKSMSGKMTDSVKKNADHLVELIKNRELEKIKILKVKNRL